MYFCGSALTHASIWRLESLRLNVRAHLRRAIAFMTVIRVEFRHTRAQGSHTMRPSSSETCHAMYPKPPLARARNGSSEVFSRSRSGKITLLVLRQFHVLNWVRVWLQVLATTHDLVYMLSRRLTNFYEPLARFQEFDGVRQCGRQNFFQACVRGIAARQPEHLRRRAMSVEQF